MVDHRFSPGIPEDVARMVGYDPKLSGEGKLFESDTLTCAHCKTVVVKNLFRTRERASCAKCGFHYICDFCAIRADSPDYSHAPFDKSLEDAVRETFGSPSQLLTEGT